MEFCIAIIFFRNPCELIVIAGVVRALLFFAFLFVFLIFCPYYVSPALALHEGSAFIQLSLLANKFRVPYLCA